MPCNFSLNSDSFHPARTDFCLSASEHSLMSASSVKLSGGTPNTTPDTAILMASMSVSTPTDEAGSPIVVFADKAVVQSNGNGASGKWREQALVLRVRLT